MASHALKAHKPVASAGNRTAPKKTNWSPAIGTTPVAQVAEPPAMGRRRCKSALRGQNEILDMLGHEKQNGDRCSSEGQSTCTILERSRVRVPSPVHSQTFHYDNSIIPISSTIIIHFPSVTL